MSAWGLQTRIMATLAAVAVLTLTGIAVAGVMLESVRQQQHEVVDNYFEAVTRSDRQFVEVLDVHAAVRAYANTGNRARLDAAQDVEILEGEGRSRIRDLLAGDPEATAALGTAEEATRDWWRGWAEPTVAAVDQDGLGAVSPQDVAAGDQLFVDVRDAHDAYIQTLAEQRELEVVELDTRNERLFAAVVAVAVVAILAVALLGFALRRWVTGPVTRLAAETQAVRAGDLNHRVEVSGPPEIVELSRDVEEMRRQLVEEIATVREATERLEIARDALERQSTDLARSNRELEQFAYVASHDLQEPLRKVASFCQLLEKRYGGQLDERGEQYIHFAVDGAKRMQQLINDLLEFSRVGRLTSGRTEVDLDDCLSRALGNLGAAIEESGAAVSNDDLPVVLGEAPLLTQVLQNLVANAVKFRGDDPPRIHIGARAVDDGWELSCSDNGIGIEPQYRDRVFVIFQRLHPKDVYSGTGIGLSMCKKIVEYHGGRIWVDDTVGQGTTIRFTLPAPVPQEPAEDVSTSPLEATAAAVPVGVGADVGVDGDLRQDDRAQAPGTRSGDPVRPS